MNQKTQKPAQIRHALTVKREDDFAAWYQQVVSEGEMAEESGVRGCMVIKPWGYGIWERIQKIMDAAIKEAGVDNCYFPLFIPLSYFSKEADHVEGFAKEMAVVTHHRLIGDGKGGLIPDPEAKLEEPLIVRPTSETVIGAAMARWVQSWRDLPLMVNQWANVVRWEMRTRMFLRTSEFLWQEGHTAHATQEEAVEETVKMLHVYADFVENYMALPVIKGVKSANERFAGAVDTYCIEAMMQDGKALQAGTSHFLGQNFAKAFDVRFSDKDNNYDYVWATSWGVSTRLIGALVMAHSDDEGLILPPRIAPLQVVIVPIYKGEEQKAMIDEKVAAVVAELKAKGIRVKYDDTDNARPGWKFAEWEKKGVPVRLTFGARDIVNGIVEIARRDTSEKQNHNLEGLVGTIEQLLEDIQQNMFNKAKTFRDENIRSVDSWDEFMKTLEEQSGFISAHWDGTPETEEKIKELSKATIRCIPLDNPQEEGKCILTGNPSKERVLFARSY